MRLIRALTVVALIIALHARIWGAESVRVFVGNRPLLFPLAAALVLSVALHELLHVAGYVWLGGAPMEAVHVEWRGVVIVARCDVPLPARSYRAAVALPGLLLGAVPTLVGLVSGTGWLTVYGAVMLGASAGDAAVLWALRKYRADEEVVDRSGGRQS
ncbi:MAG TPA: DUF3267 domain-containing protein [Gemmatimonadaceae bacterium]|nr:DUF3267 domain-containing protein [Gemmatimonadaceae bacterium]